MFIWKGKSSTEMGVKTKLIYSPCVVSPRIEELKILGRDGVFIIDNGKEPRRAGFLCLAPADTKNKSPVYERLCAWLLGTDVLVVDGVSYNMTCSKLSQDTLLWNGLRFSVEFTEVFK